MSYRLGLITSGAGGVASRVAPSGSARHTASAPIDPLAPTRFSTMTGCAHLAASFSATMRGSASAAPPAPLVINPSLYAKLAYDPTQFVPVTVMAAIPSVLLVNAAKVPANTLQDFVALVRANPDKLNYASQGTTTVSFLTTEMFKTAAGGLKITHVPYKGTAPGLAALLAGEVEVMFDNLGVTVQHVRSGRLRALAVGSERRVASLPDVPTMAEFYPGFVSIAWFSLSAPPKTPAPIAEKLSTAIGEILRLPDVAKRLADLSAEPIASTPAGMAVLMKEEAERWRAVIRAAGVKPE